MPQIPIIMPQLGESIAEATIVNIAVKPGERGWTAEFAVPLTEFIGETKLGGKTWCLNVTRVVPEHQPTIEATDGGRLIIGETVGKRLTSFDIAADGALSNRRLFAQFEDCFPDGICLDAEGGIWVADPRGHRVVRVMEGQGIVQAIALPDDRNAFACMLGGDDRRTLYVCTSTASGPAMAEKRDGRVEIVRVDVPGAGLP